MIQGIRLAGPVHGLDHQPVANVPVEGDEGLRLGVLTHPLPPIHRGLFVGGLWVGNQSRLAG